MKTHKEMMLVAGLMMIAARAQAQSAVAMAPPFDVSPGAAVNESIDSVFHWSEIPQGETVALTRAVFDRGGYQLYDTAGETIVVPFVNQNLYVMKFGLSPDSNLYFVNDGGTPTLYVPRNGYLENATTSGGRWYPFSQQFRPQQPVYLGVAPNWSQFVDMGWYPGMNYWGGYYSSNAFYNGAVFSPTAGLAFQIGGQPYYGWNAYQTYYLEHPGFLPLGYYPGNLYRLSNRSRTTFHGFRGNNSIYYAHRPFVGVRNGYAFQGGSSGYYTGTNGYYNGGYRGYTGGNAFVGGQPFRGNTGSVSGVNRGNTARGNEIRMLTGTRPTVGSTFRDPGRNGGSASSLNRVARPAQSAPQGRISGPGSGDGSIRGRRGH